MTTADLATKPLDVRSLHERMGRVFHQPVSVHSFTNKRFTVNFRVRLDRLQRILPATIEPDEVGNTGYGMLGMCACDFWVTRLGWLPIPPVRNNDMLCRVSAKIPKGECLHRAYYTLRSDSSSRFLGFLGRRFSHFRKQVSPFERVDDGTQYFLKCDAQDPLCRGELRAMMETVTKALPSTSCFANIQEATEFLFNLDGSCGYHFGRDMLSFQRIEYPEWDMSFCHDVAYQFPLIDYLNEAFDLRMEFDCALFMQNTPQTWNSCWMYRNRVRNVASRS